MKVKGFLRIFLILLVLAFNIGCDQVSKSIVRRKMTDYQQISFLDNHFTLIKVENPGAFLSVGSSLSGPARTILLNFLPLVAVVIGLIFILIKPTLPKFLLLGVIMVVGGGIGNVYDRIMHGSVTDFMHINFVIFQTGIFNVADMSITFGVIIILLQAWLEKKRGTIESNQENTN